MMSNKILKLHKPVVQYRQEKENVSFFVAPEGAGLLGESIIPKEFKAKESAVKYAVACTKGSKRSHVVKRITETGEVKGEWRIEAQ